VLEHWIGRRERDARMAAAVPDRAIPDAIERAVALARSAPETALLHGDLHPGNVLVSEDGLVAIDPRPCAGDPAYDAADWVLFRAAPGSWRRRAEALGAAVGVGGDRVMAWCSAFGALHAASAASRGAAPARVAALLAL
jgi:streptomycin 6-kinase